MKTSSSEQKKRHRDMIQEEVDKILAFSSEEDWINFLEKKGCAHNVYYHYTTLGTLKAILESSFWKFKRADLSNDPAECPVHSASFTTSQLSSMGMWHMYSRLDREACIEDLGIRIGIPDSIFKKIFTGNVTWFSRDQQGVFHEFSKAGPKVFDMAYWHFGKDKHSSLAIYRNYQFPGSALHFLFPEGKQLPPCFKKAIWRKEEEVRVCHDFTQLPDVPEELYLKVEPEYFREMTFRLSPAATNHRELQKLFPTNSVPEVLLFFLSRILGGKLKISQFQLPNEHEQWQSPEECGKRKMKEK